MGDVLEVSIPIARLAHLVLLLVSLLFATARASLMLAVDSAIPRAAAVLARFPSIVSRATLEVFSTRRQARVSVIARLASSPTPKQSARNAVDSAPIARVL